MKNMAMDQSLLSKEHIHRLCAGMGFHFSDTVTEGLSIYLSLLTRWNRVMNLVGKARPEDILHVLIADSFYLAKFLDDLPLPESPEIWDLGSGAGLPGIPLRLLRQQGQYTLVEARDKRAGFLQTVLAACPLQGTAVFRGRVEVFMPTRPKANMTISRAFMPWEQVLRLVAPFISSGGLCVFLMRKPAPTALPKEWSLFLQQKYSTAGQERYFWALRLRAC